MTYTRMTLEVTVNGNDLECFEQALHNALEEIEEHTTTFDTEIELAEVGEPFNAVEIAAPVD